MLERMEGALAEAKESRDRLQELASQVGAARDELEPRRQALVARLEEAPPAPDGDDDALVFATQAAEAAASALREAEARSAEASSAIGMNQAAVQGIELSFQEAMTACRSAKKLYDTARKAVGPAAEAVEVAKAAFAEAEQAVLEAEASAGPAPSTTTSRPMGRRTAARKRKPGALPAGFEAVPVAAKPAVPEPEEEEDGATTLMDRSAMAAKWKSMLQQHSEPMERKIRVRYRIDGVCQMVMEPPKKMLNAMSSRIKIMAGLDIAERRCPQDGKFQLTYTTQENVSGELGNDIDLFNLQAQFVF